MTLKHFTREEFGASYALMDPLLLRRLDDLRDRIGVPIVVHPDTGGHVVDSQHPYKAVDCHAIGVSLGDFWLAAERDPWLRGIGLYPYWVIPGLHLDTRTTDLRMRWWRDQVGTYRPLAMQHVDTLARDGLI